MEPIKRAGFETLNASGVYPLPEPVLNAAELAAIRGHLAQTVVYRSHVAKQAKELPKPFEQIHGRGVWPMYCHHMHDVVRAPALLAAAIRFTPLVTDYFGEPALLFSLNAYWSQPSAQTHKSTHQWHRDEDDRKFLALMIYGTDVEAPEDGAHCWLPGTQPDRIAPGTPSVEYCAAHRQIVLGCAGTGFLTTGRSLHLGLKPTTRPRLMLWARWGVSDPPPAYQWDLLTPLPFARLPAGAYPQDAEMQKAIRLVVG